MHNNILTRLKYRNKLNLKRHPECSLYILYSFSCLTEKSQGAIYSIPFTHTFVGDINKLSLNNF